ncbi:hypothetical protein [Sinorhizobium psoraleae]|uniref:Uncharacterized protein n=1 Tax=Sinorhizobium psoraleae TaxID=520838 RepID=A0ABT4KNA2_9HYPH|nr:hypothetical protein [Sinorhizobium psoraleae]MCZ4093452.1 hypothetical protein [Sinorhizobium psoraleae]
MILRARFRVPDGVTFKGQQLRVGDLRLYGEPIVTGGQIADVITMTLYALAIAGAPEQDAIACVYSPCRDANHPDFIQAIPFGESCPPSGMSPQLNSVLAAGAAQAAGASQSGPEWRQLSPGMDDEGALRYSRTPSFS